jgi:hypothetical protein
MKTGDLQSPVLAPLPPLNLPHGMNLKRSPCVQPGNFLQVLRGS